VISLLHTSQCFVSFISCSCASKITKGSLLFKKSKRKSGKNLKCREENREDITMEHHGHVNGCHHASSESQCEREPLQENINMQTHTYNQVLLNKTEKYKIFFCVLNNGLLGLYKPYMSSYK
jgi:hypothetical protein